MLHGDSLGLLAGAVALGVVHGIEPGHGWPVAASYALDRANRWLYGLAASLVIGLGHLVSSIAMVAAFFYAKAYFDLTQVNEPVTILEGVRIGGPVGIVAGVVLVALGIREYRHGHRHGHGPHVTATESAEGDETDHEHGLDSRHAHDAVPDPVHDDGEGNDHDPGGLRSRLVGVVPFLGGHRHGPDDQEQAADRGLVGLAWFAFALGFAHEEEFEIIALCAGSTHCLELMTAYALTVIAGIVGLTLLLIAGYEHAEATVERYTPYLPAFSAAVLVLLGVGFVLGLL